MPSLYQGYVGMSVLYSGLIFGILLQVYNIIYKINKSKISRFLIDFIFALIGGFIFWLTIFRSNLGIFRIFLLLIYIFGVVISNFAFSGVVNAFDKLYNISKRKK